MFFLQNINLAFSSSSPIYVFIKGGELSWWFFIIFLLYIDDTWEGGFVLYRYIPRLRLDIRRVYIYILCYLFTVGFFIFRVGLVPYYTM